MRSKKNSPLLRLSLLLAAVGSLTAAEKADLKRITPVPRDEPIPVADFFRPPLLEDPVLNLAGTHLAAVVTAGEDRRLLMVYDFDKKTSETIRAAGERDIVGVRWLDDNRVIYSLTSEKLATVGLFAANVGSLQRTYPLLQISGVQFVSVPEKNRRHPLVWITSDVGMSGRNRGVVAVDTDLQSGEVASISPTDAEMGEIRDRNEQHVVVSYPRLDEGLGIGTGYLADKDGELAFCFITKDAIQTLYRLVNGQWEKCPVDLDEIEIVDCGNRPGELVVRGPRQPNQPRALQFMDAATGKLGDVLLQDAGYNFVGSLYRDPVTHEVTGAAYERNGPQATWFAEKDRAIQKLVQGSFPGQIVRVVDRDRSGLRLLLSTYSDRQPPIYQWVDLGKHTMGLVKNSAPWIDPARMLPMQILRFKTRDGHPLDAYLTLPAGASKQHPVPLIVLPHGGPYERDTWHFDARAQFLASRGYAVLQPNYRGSPGYEWLFPELDRWDYRKMPDDVVDATKAVLHLGLVDSGRVAIMGEGFGGYLALAGAVNEPDLYRSVITITGTFDWEQTMQDEKYNRYRDPTYDWLYRRIGDPAKEPQKFDAIAPGRHVDRIRAAVFVAHDRTNPIDEARSRRLVSELEKARVPHEVMVVGDEVHGLGFLDHRVELYSAIEAFLARQMAAAPAAAPAARP